MDSTEAWMCPCRQGLNARRRRNEIDSIHRSKEAIQFGEWTWLSGPFQFEQDVYWP
jgi:hypothetical protein